MRRCNSSIRYDIEEPWLEVQAKYKAREDKICVKLQRSENKTLSEVNENFEYLLTLLNMLIPQME